MTDRATLVDKAPLSEFVGKMIEAHHRRLKATTVADKHAIEREMEAFFRRYVQRTEAPAQEPETVNVPRATLRRRVRPGPPSRYAGDGFDHKLAAAGDREDD